MSNKSYQKNNSWNLPQPKVKSNYKNNSFSLQNKEDNDLEISNESNEYKGIAPGAMIDNVQRSMRSQNYPFPSAPIQPKLTIGAPGDKYEQEADEVAADVVQRINTPASPPTDDENNSIQRKPISIIQRQEDSLDELQMKGVGFKAPNIQADFENNLNSAKSGGSSLDNAFRAKIEPEMNADFSGVKVHTDSVADNLSKSIQAKAFTTGNHIFMKQGEYNPSSKSGQELLTHELTHTIQQGASPSIQKKPERKSAPNINKVNQISIQAAFEPAYINDTAQLHDIDNNDKDKGKVSGGKKFKAGDEIEVDKSDSKASGAWYKAKGAGKSGYIRASKVVLKSLIDPPEDPELESETFDEAGEVFEDIGGGFDSLATGFEQGFLKSNQGGMLNDMKANQQSHGGAKTGFDIASGAGDTFAGLFGMIASAKEIVSSEKKLSWDNLAAGYGFLESAGKGVSGATKVVDSIAKASGMKNGVGKSDLAGKVTGAIADGLSGVKNAALGIIGLYKLYKSQRSEKGKDALVTLKTLTDAAASGASVAKNAYDIIGNGIPMSIIYTIPALSIGVSAINLIIKLWDALKAGNIKGDMSESAIIPRTQVANDLGEPTPTDENIKNSNIFEKDKRGTFPNYKVYFRTKKEVRESIKELITFANNKEGEIPDKIENLESSYIGPKTKGEYEQTTIDTHNEVKNKIDSASINDSVKNTLKTQIGNPKTQDEFKEQTVGKLKAIDKNIDEYEFVDKMSEINQKRQTSGWTEVILELVSMAGDITTIAVGATGIGAAIGQSVKAASSGYKVVHGGAKFAQKLYRDKGDGSNKKSSKNKHEEYVKHAKFIYQQIADLNPSKPPTEADKQKEEQLKRYIEATGVNYGLWFAVRYNPSTQVEMLVEAMKER